LTIRQAALRVARHRLAHVDPGAPGEALLAPESHGPGRERERSRGYVRLRQLAVRECQARNGAAADATPGSQMSLRRLAKRRLRKPPGTLIGLLSSAEQRASTGLRSCNGASWAEKLDVSASRAAVGDHQEEATDAPHRHRREHRRVPEAVREEAAERRAD